MLRLIDFTCGAFVAACGLTTLFTMIAETIADGFVAGVMTIPARQGPEVISALSVAMLIAWAGSSAWLGMRKVFEAGQ